mgnify:CR=1 FL=1
MNNITKTLLGSIVSITSIFGGVEAKASNYDCYWTVNNDHVCVYNVRGNSAFRTFDMNVNGKYVGEQGVRCNPNHRYNYVENANGIACFQFN